jgi:hypothetical protein
LHVDDLARFDEQGNEVVVVDEQLTGKEEEWNELLNL